LPGCASSRLLHVPCSRGSLRTDQSVDFYVVVASSFFRSLRIKLKLRPVLTYVVAPRVNSGIFLRSCVTSFQHSMSRPVAQALYRRVLAYILPARFFSSAVRFSIRSVIQLLLRRVLEKAVLSRQNKKCTRKGEKGHRRAMAHALCFILSWSDLLKASNSRFSRLNFPIQFETPCQLFRRKPSNIQENNTRSLNYTPEKKALGEDSGVKKPLSGHRAYIPSAREIGTSNPHISTRHLHSHDRLGMFFSEIAWSLMKQYGERSAREPRFLRAGNLE